MSGGASRVFPLVPAPDNRISGPSERVQIFEFWVTSNRPGSIQIAAEITLQGVTYRSDGRNGYDSSVTLEAIAPSSINREFHDKKTRVLDLPSLLNEPNYTVSLYMRKDGRSICWIGRVSTPDTTKSLQPNFSHRVMPQCISWDEKLCWFYWADLWCASHRPHFKGFRSLAQDPGVISILSHLTQDYPNKPGRTAQLSLQVFDEYGTEHRVRVNPDIATRSYTLS